MAQVKEQLEMIFGEYGNTYVECNGEYIPPWYDETKFRRGQKYFQKNKLGFIMAELCGLLCLMGLPEVLKWTDRNLNIKEITPLQMFKRSRRIIGSLYEYNFDSFGPKTKLWREMIQFRKLLEISTKNGRKSELTGINQRFLVFVQFSNMGLVLIKPEKFAISKNNVEDIEGMLHLWRVIGWLYGINDCVNICRGSISETKEICEVLLRNIFTYTIKSNEEKYTNLINKFFRSLINVFPLLDEGAIKFYIREVLESNTETTVEEMGLNDTLEDYSRNVQHKCILNNNINSMSLYSKMNYKFLQVMISACSTFITIKWISNQIVSFLMNVLIYWPIFLYICFYFVQYSKYLFLKLKVNLKVN